MKDGAVFSYRVAMARHFQPRPHALDAVAMAVDEVRAAHGGLVALGGHSGPGAHVPDVGAEGVRRVALVSDHPRGRARQPGQQRRRARQLVRLAWRQVERNRTAPAVGHGGYLGAKAATRASKRLTHVAFGSGPPFLGAPAAFACALTFVPSRPDAKRQSGNAMPNSMPPARSCASLSKRSQTPCLPQRMNVCAAPHHVPSAAGIARQAAPLRCRQMIASSVRRRSSCGVLPHERTASTSGSNTAHCASVSTRSQSLLAIHPISDRQLRANRP